MLKSKLSRRQLGVAAAMMIAAPSLAPGSVRAQALPLLTLDGIRRAGKLRIGCEATYPPFTFRDRGEIVGYDGELATAMCRSLGVTPEFIDTQWSGVIPALYAGRFDIIMSSMSYTRARLERVAFSIPYAEAGQSLLIRASSSLGCSGGHVKPTDERPELHGWISGLCSSRPDARAAGGSTRWGGQVGANPASVQL